MLPQPTIARRTLSMVSWSRQNLTGNAFSPRSVRLCRYSTVSLTNASLGSRRTSVPMAIWPSTRAEGRAQAEVDPHAEREVPVVRARDVQAVGVGELRRGRGWRRRGAA